MNDQQAEQIRRLVNNPTAAAAVEYIKYRFQDIGATTFINHVLGGANGTILDQAIAQIIDVLPAAEIIQNNLGNLQLAQLVTALKTIRNHTYNIDMLRDRAAQERTNPAAEAALTNERLKAQAEMGEYVVGALALFI